MKGVSMKWHPWNETTNKLSMCLIYGGRLLVTTDGWVANLSCLVSLNGIPQKGYSCSDATWGQSEGAGLTRNSLCIYGLSFILIKISF